MKQCLLNQKCLVRASESAQKKVEGNNYDMRKSLLDYDNIVSEQRKIIYKKRNEILDAENMTTISEDTLRDYADETWRQSHCSRKDT